MSEFAETLPIRLRAAYLNMHRCANRHFARFDATADQYAVLTFLAEKEGMTQQELVKLCSSDKRTIGKMLDLLESKGLVERRSHPTDGRARALYLTDVGRTTQSDIYNSAEYLRRRVEEAVPPEDLQTVLRCLRDIADRLDPDALGGVIRGKTKAASAHAERSKRPKAADPIETER